MFVFESMSFEFNTRLDLKLQGRFFGVEFVFTFELAFELENSDDG